MYVPHHMDILGVAAIGLLIALQCSVGVGCDEVVCRLAAKDYA